MSAKHFDVVVVGGVPAGMGAAQSRTAMGEVPYAKVREVLLAQQAILI